MEASNFEVLVPMRTARVPRHIPGITLNLRYITINGLAMDRIDADYVVLMLDRTNLQLIIKRALCGTENAVKLSKNGQCRSKLIFEKGIVDALREATNAGDDILFFTGKPHPEKHYVLFDLMKSEKLENRGQNGSK